MKNTKFSITKRLLSFKYAFNGLKILIHEEHNARIHVVAAALVIVISFVLQIEKFEWLVILLCIGIVLTAEIINSAIENICDFISPDKHEKIKRIKDLSAAAVLVVAFISATVAFLIFIPKLSV